MATANRSGILSHPSFWILVAGATALGWGFGAWIAGGLDSVDKTIAVVGGVLLMIGVAWFRQRADEAKR